MWRRLFWVVLTGCSLLGACTSPGERAPSFPPGEVGPYKVGKPYQVEGVWYYPKEDWTYDETGIASWYGPGFDGKATANGETYDEMAMTAAHKTLPLPVVVRVTNLENGKSTVVRINDRGPFVNGRIIDLSRRAAQLLDIESKGTAKVRVQILADESRQVIAIAQSRPGSAGFDNDLPEAAPLEAVEVKPLATQAPLETPAVQPLETAGKVAPIAAAAPLASPAPAVRRVAVGPSDIFIQAGAFRSQSKADSLRQQLDRFGAAQVYPATVGDTRFYRVRIGPLASIEDADSVLNRLLASGYSDARVVVD